MAIHCINTTCPLVSIAMTTYNGERYLRQQLDSLLAQDYENFEILVADDGSSDGTLAILEEYAAAQKISFYQNPKNLGYIKNFEQVIAHSQGQYIALCDQDDIWYPQKIRITLEKLIHDNALLCYCDADLVNHRAEAIGNNLLSHSRIGPIVGDDYKKFYFLNTVNGCTAIIDRKLYTLALPFADKVPHDWWLAYIAAFNKRLSFVNQRLMGYRMHSQNTVGINYRVKKSNLWQYIKKKLSVYSKTYIDSKISRPIRWNWESVIRFEAFYQFEKKYNADTTDLETLKNWSTDKLKGNNLAQYKPFFVEKAKYFGIKLRSLLFETQSHEILRAKIKLTYSLLIPIVIPLIVAGAIWLL